MRFELFAHLLLQGNAGIKHDPKQTNDFQIGVQVGVNLLDGVDQIGQTLQRKILALHRNNHTMCCTQTIEGKHGQ